MPRFLPGPLWPVKDELCLYVYQEKWKCGNLQEAVLFQEVGMIVTVVELLLLHVLIQICLKDVTKDGFHPVA